MNDGNDEILNIDDQIINEFRKYVDECKKLVEKSQFRNSRFLPSVFVVVAEHIIPKKFEWEASMTGQSFGLVLVNYSPSFKEIVDGKNIN